MTNKRARNKRATIERAYHASSVGTMGIQGDYAKYAGGNSVTIPATVLSKMLQNLAPQANQAKDFAPGSPLLPYEGVVPKGGPRLYAFSPGTNINSNDRTLGMQDVPTFAQLRSLAQLFSGICLCERVILDMIPKLTPVVQIRKVFAEAGAKEKNYQPEIKQWMKFIEMPDPQQRMDIHSWLRMAWTETTQIDALSLYKQKDRGGRLLGLNIVDGTTVKPIIDERGMIPQPPYPAYQQYPYGVPGDQYTIDQMLYYRESPRSFTPYGFSRVERIILEVNQALRKKQRDLAKFTEGNVPAGIMEVPDSSSWTPDQIDTFEQLWNALLAGNIQQQARIKFTQPGMKYTQFADPITGENMTEFDQFLLNVAAACYGLSMGDLAFTASIHKSADEGQQNMMFRRTLDPLVSVYGRILTNAMRESTGCDLLEYGFAGFSEAEDIVAQSTAYGGFVDRGILSRAAAARMMSFPEIPETGPFILQQGAPPLFLEDLANPAMRKAQQAATLAGLQGAVNPQTGGTNTTGGSSPAGSTLPQTGDSQAQSGQAGSTQGASPGQSDDSAGDALDAAMDEADKSLDELDAASRMDEAEIVRADPVRGPNGEFGNYASTKKSTPKTRKTGTKKTTKKATGAKLSPAQRVGARVTKMAARFEKMAARKIGKHWTAAQAQAASKLASTFSQIASSIHAGNADKTDGLLDTAWSQAKTLFGSNTKSLAGMSHALNAIDTANDKGLLRMAVGEIWDEEMWDDDEWLDKYEEEAEPTVSRVSETLARIEDQLRLLRAQTVMPVQSEEEEEYYNEQRPLQDTEELPQRAGDRAITRHTLSADEHATTAGCAALDNPRAATNEHSAANADYRRWRARAIEDVKAGRQQRPFESALIPKAEQNLIISGLEICHTPEDVRAIFEMVRMQPLERDTSPKELASVSGGNPQQSKSDWKLRW